MIIAVRNEARHLAGLLDGVSRQDYPPDRFEVLVVDGKSTDGTVAMAAARARRDPRVRLLHNPKRWAGAGRNVAIAACRGDVVVIIDGHAAVQDPQFLSRLVEVLEHTGADCVRYPQPLVSETNDATQRAIVAARACALGRHPASVTLADEPGFVSPHPGAVAYRRAVLARVGGYDESFDACEDLELTFRVSLNGFRCYCSPLLSTPYYARASMGALFYQQLRYGRGRVRLLRRHPRTFAITTFLPALVVLGAVAAPALAFLPGTAVALYALAAVAYVGSLVVQATYLARDCGWRLLPRLLVALLAIHVGAGTGALVELASAATCRHSR